MANVYSVGQVNSYIKHMFEEDFLLNRIFVKGEVSNCKYHTSGHIYFTLKDEKGALQAVMFVSQRKGLSFRLEEGQCVIAEGGINVYERDGKYQLYVRNLTLDGAGALYQKFQELKNTLEEMGMFDSCYKRPIPRFIKKLGVVTAPTGAAVRDIIKVAKRRNPYIQVILYPALVQGEGAAESIVKGIQALEKQKPDVMIVGRGGGSIEDLWAFNEEPVARAIFDCSVPIISAVGHETDFTIADFTADLRAPTPSAAAELAVFSYEDFQNTLVQYRRSLCQNMERKMERLTERLEKSRLKLSYHSPENQIREKRMYAAELETRLREAEKQILSERRRRLELWIEKWNGLSPLLKLNQGFSYVSDQNGRTITEIGQVEAGAQVTIQVVNGEILAEVTGKKAVRRVQDGKNKKRAECGSRI